MCHGNMITEGSNIRLTTTLDTPKKSLNSCTDSNGFIVSGKLFEELAGNQGEKRVDPEHPVCVRKDQDPETLLAMFALRYVAAASIGRLDVVCEDDHYRLNFVFEVNLFF